MKMIDEQSQPQPERPKMTIAMDWKEFTPEMKAYIAMTAFQSQELAQVFIQQSEDPAFVQKIEAKWRSRKSRKAREARWSAGRSISRRYRPRVRAGWKCKRFATRASPKAGRRNNLNLKEKLHEYCCQGTDPAAVPR